MNKFCSKDKYVPYYLVLLLGAIERIKHVGELREQERQMMQAGFKLV